MDLTMATTDELLVQAKEIEAELLKRLDEELAKLDARRAELLAMKPPAKTEEKKKRVKSSRPAKFRNPGNPEQTWTGRGKAPAWMAGLDRESCLIPMEG